MRARSISMSIPLLVLLAPGALSAMTPATGSASAGKLVLLRGVESRVEVDAQGHVVGVRSDETLPPALASVLEQNVRKLEFAPPQKDGRAVPGVTFVRHDVCAAPVDGAYRLAVKYRGNGPSYNIERVAPAYPRDALRRGESSAWDVAFSVAPDGTASIDTLTRTDAPKRHQDPGFADAIKGWVSALRFQPEQLDGRPVGTRISTTVEFTVESKPMAAPDSKTESTC